MEFRNRFVQLGPTICLDGRSGIACRLNWKCLSAKESDPGEKSARF